MKQWNLQKEDFEKVPNQEGKVKYKRINRIRTVYKLGKQKIKDLEEKRLRELLKK